MVHDMDDKQEKSRFKKLQNVARRRKLALDEYMRASLSVPQGRDFMYWLLEIAKIGQNPFTANALTTSFNCGELNIGQQIQAHMIEVAPADYLKMLQEKEDERLNDRSDTSDRDADSSDS